MVQCVGDEDVPCCHWLLGLNDAEAHQTFAAAGSSAGARAAAALRRRELFTEPGRPY